jgi:hypothetical protein
MTNTERIAALEAMCAELFDRVWTLEKWAVAHEAEQWQHRVYLAERGRNRTDYTAATFRKAPLMMKLPGALHDPLL